MAAIAPTWQPRVVNLALLPSRHVRITGIVQDGNFPTELDRVIVFFFGAVRAGKDLRPGFRIKHVVDGRRRRIVQIGSCGPNSVQRRGLIGSMLQNLVRLAVGTELARQPTLVYALGARMAE